MTSLRLSERSQGPRPPRPAGASRPGVRDQILEAAVAEFADRGFQEASLAAIARRVGVTAPLVLYHFGSKANLWRAAVEAFCGQFGEAVERGIEDGRGMDSREALRLLVRRLVQFFATNRAAYRLLRDEGGAAGGKGDWFSSKNLRPILDRIEAVYSRAVEDGHVRPAPFESTLFMIVGAASCYLESRALMTRIFGATDDESAWVQNYADQVVGLCFDGISMPERRPDAQRPMLAALRAASGPRTSIVNGTNGTNGNGHKNAAAAAREAILA